MNHLQLCVLRVAIVHSLLGQLLGGGERLVEEMGSLLVQRGFQVAYVTLSSELRQLYKPLDGKLFAVTKDLPMANILRSYLRPALMLLSCLRCLGTFHPDILILSTDHQIAWLLKLLSHRKVIIYVHWPEFLFRRRNSILKRTYFTLIDYLERQSVIVADAILVNSGYTANAVRTVFGDLNTVTAYPGVNVELFRVRRKSQKTILAVSRITPLKQLDFLINVHSNVVKHIPDSILIIAGFLSTSDRPYFQRLVDLAKGLGLEKNVIFKINLSDEELSKLYGESEIFLYPREGEHFGMALVEAIVSGCVPVVPDSGGLREIVKLTGCGVVAPPHDEKAWAHAIVDLLSRPDRLKKMSEHGRNRVASIFTWDNFLKILLQAMSDRKK